MRVALVYRNFNLAGSLERDSVLAARALARQGVEVHCYCNPKTRDLDLPGVVFHDVGTATVSRSRVGYPLETASFALRATRLLREHRDRYDIVHVRGTSAWEHDVVTVHGVTKAHQLRWPDDAGRGYRAARLRSRLAPLLHPQVSVGRTVERIQFRPGRYVRVIAVTELVREDVIRVHGIAADRIDVVPLPVDVASFVSDDGAGIRSQLGLTARDPLLLFVGHAFERKGLLDAIKALRGLDPPAHLVVVGSGPRERFARAAAAAGVEGRVHFVGATKEPHIYFAAADMLVLPTKQDPWGLPLIEAMAAGIPVVSTRAAGAAAVVAEAGAGLILPDGSPDGVRAAVAELLGDPGRMSAMGERGRRAAVRYGEDMHARDLIEVYERALRERPRRP